MPDYSFIGGWTIRETAYVPEEESARATIFALANGYMGSRGSGEELSPELPGIKGTYINGIYDTPQGKLTEREFPNIQDWTLISFTVDGEPFDLSTGEILEYSRDLNMREAVLHRRVRWKSPSGKIVVLEGERFLCMAPEYLHLAAINWRLSVEQDSEINLVSAIDSAVSNRWAYHFKSFHMQAEPDSMYLETKTFDPGYKIGVLAKHELSGPKSIFHENMWPTDRRIESHYKFKLESGETATLRKLVSLHDSRFSEGDLISVCRKDVDAAHQLGYDALLNAHISQWTELWKASDVAIDGDDDAQMGIRFSIFHILAAAPYHNGEISIPARGLQGQDYYGSIFWDCEIFVLPLLTYTQPQAARNALSYRFATLNGARRKAGNMGFKGAYYAWQSQETGDDQCDLYVFDNPMTGEKIRSYFADEQIHISADIVYALWQYFEATRDVDFLCEGGAEIAIEVARFFVSRATYNSEKNRYEILSVLGPDEYHERVNNNAFTNAMAAESVKRATQIVEAVRKQNSDNCKELLERLGVNIDEVKKWREFMDKLYIPCPDPKTGLIEQFDGYFGLKDEPVDDTKKRLAHPDLHPGGPLGPFQATRNIKQADIIMLLYLLRDRYNQETKRCNWEYYEKRTAHDSSLSPMAYSLVAADVGMVDWAYKYYMFTSHIDLESYGPHWNLGVHAASLGGAWLDIVHGFCQLNLKLDGIHVARKPVLPGHWNNVRFSFVWNGHRFIYKSNGRDVQIESEATVDVPVFFSNKKSMLKAGGVVLKEYTIQRTGERERSAI